MEFCFTLRKTGPAKTGAAGPIPPALNMQGQHHAVSSYVCMYTISCALCLQYLLHLGKVAMCWLASYFILAGGRDSYINKMINVLIRLVA